MKGKKIILKPRVHYLVINGITIIFIFFLFGFSFSFLKETK